ncbi:hypothetical protein TOPH_03848 [Tolypocladium ophioglossoides CBS 100239]|uniref:Uncharacterized protein n=1 Tax=Tolypocladium ophioglossoides (strain CBS 100239) TaxID=1163406 RepID=A0A0L0NBT0_TOLOC|nr:hypothetical protein TOPH_03848 [Tolypocladium ophioglossoides CBS 100239]
MFTSPCLLDYSPLRSPSTRTRAPSRAALHGELPFRTIRPPTGRHGLLRPSAHGAGVAHPRVDGPPGSGIVFWLAATSSWHGAPSSHTPRHALATLGVNRASEAVYALTLTPSRCGCFRHAVLRATRRTVPRASASSSLVAPRGAAARRRLRLRPRGQRALRGAVATRAAPRAPRHDGHDVEGPRGGGHDSAGVLFGRLGGDDAERGRVGDAVAAWAELLTRMQSGEFSRAFSRCLAVPCTYQGNRSVEGGVSSSSFHVAAPCPRFRQTPGPDTLGHSGSRPALIRIKSYRFGPESLIFDRRPGPRLSVRAGQGSAASLARSWAFWDVCPAVGYWLEVHGFVFHTPFSLRGRRRPVIWRTPFCSHTRGRRRGSCLMGRSWLATARTRRRWLKTSNGTHTPSRPPRLMPRNTWQGPDHHELSAAVHGSSLMIPQCPDEGHAEMELGSERRLDRGPLRPLLKIVLDAASRVCTRAPYILACARTGQTPVRDVGRPAKSRAPPIGALQGRGFTRSRLPGRHLTNDESTRLEASQA